MRDWAEFTDSTRFAAPRNPESAQQRVTGNLRYYATNYGILSVGIAVLWTGLLGGWRGGLLIGLVGVGVHAYFHQQGLDNRIENAKSKLRDKVDSKLDQVFKKVDEYTK
jgi:hypothetical protein